MARKLALPEAASAVGEETILVTDPSVPDEYSKMLEMMESIAGEGSETYVYTLHRASEKNRAVASTFLCKYPLGVTADTILEDAKYKYKGGNFVLVVREGNIIKKKSGFSAEADPDGKDGDIPTIQAGHSIDQAFDRMSRAVEKSVLLDKVQGITQGKRGEDDAMVKLFIAMQTNQTELMKLLLPMLMQKKEERSTFTDLRDMAKFLQDYKDGKIDEGGETSLTDAIVRSLPDLAAAFARRGGPPVSPVPPGAAVPKLPAPPPPGGPSAPPGNAPPNPMAVSFNRVLEEIRFCLTRTETEQVYEHLLNYVENYMPGSIEEMVNQSEDAYVAWVMQFDPSFPARESFFRNVHKYALKTSQPEGGEG